MKKAVDCVLVGKLSVREASGHFSLPKSSLGDRVCALKKENQLKWHLQWVDLKKLSMKSWKMTSLNI